MAVGAHTALHRMDTEATEAAWARENVSMYTCDLEACRHICTWHLEGLEAELLTTQSRKVDGVMFVFTSVQGA